MMKSYDESVKTNYKPNWAYIPDHPCRILIVIRLNIIKHQRPDIYKKILLANDPFKSKYKLFIKRREKVGIKQTEYPKAFSGYSQAIDDVYENLEKNLEDYYPAKK